MLLAALEVLKDGETIERGECCYAALGWSSLASLVLLAYPLYTLVYAITVLPAALRPLLPMLALVVVVLCVRYWTARLSCRVLLFVTLPAMRCCCGGGRGAAASRARARARVAHRPGSTSVVAIQGGNEEEEEEEGLREGQQAEADAIAGEEAEDSRRRMPALTGIDLSIAVGEGMLADLHGEDDVFDE